MAYSNRKEDLFTGLRKPRGKDRFSPMETRGQQDDPIDQSGYGSAPTAPIGQMQAPIGGMSSAQSSLYGLDYLQDFYPDHDTGYDWQNMGDIYDDWNAYNQAQFQWDWFSQNMGTSPEYGPGTSQYDSQLAAWEQAQSDYSAGFDWWNQYGPGSDYNAGGGNSMTGGSQGGFGDLGTGTAFNQNFTNPFGEGWGPSGQYGGGTSELDPNWNQYGDECLSMWQTFQGQDWTAGQYDSYDDFAVDYCG